MMLVISLCLIAFVIATAFVYCGTAKRLIESKDVWVPWWCKVIAYLWFLVGAPADYLFNKTFGSMIFRERWRERLFTARVQYHIDESTGWRHQKALQWASFLNAVDADHIKL